MNRNAIGTNRQTPQQDERHENELTAEQSTDHTGRIQPACPPWCVRHVNFDEGRPDEGFGHYGVGRQVARYDVQVERHDFPGRGEIGEVEVCLDDASLTPAEAAALGAALTAAADPDRPQTATHRWSLFLNGWTAGRPWLRVTSQALTRAELGKELVAICEEDEPADVEDLGPVGGLLLQAGGTAPHLIMLAEQTALEERIVLENAVFVLSAANPRRWSVGRVDLVGHPFLRDGAVGVWPLHSRTAAVPEQQPEVEALIAQLPGEPS